MAPRSSRRWNGFIGRPAVRGLALALAIPFVWVSLAVALAQTPSKLPVPRFASLKEERVNVRRGPSHEHAVSWIYVRKGFPVEITGEHDVWRRIRDRDGATGWVHARMLDGTRTALVDGEGLTPIRAKPKVEARVVAWAEPGVVLRLDHCDLAWCAVEGPKLSGYVERARLWGLYPNEAVK